VRRGAVRRRCFPVGGMFPRTIRIVSVFRDSRRSRRFVRIRRRAGVRGTFAAPSLIGRARAKSARSRQGAKRAMDVVHNAMEPDTIHVSVRVATAETLYRTKRDTVRLRDQADAQVLKQKFGLMRVPVGAVPRGLQRSTSSKDSSPPGSWVLNEKLAPESWSGKTSLTEVARTWKNFHHRPARDSESQGGLASWGGQSARRGFRT